MLKKISVFMFLTVLGFAGISQAEMSGSTSSKTTDLDTINMMLEYNQRMVSMTEAYLRDRSKIPADYQTVSDKEFIRKAKLEKMGPKKMAAATPAKTETTKKK